MVKMPVELCCFKNSTLFTSCCGIAILDYQYNCPKCGKSIDAKPKERWDIAMRKLYGSDELTKMRDRYKRGGL
jgi:hypothetical protein